LKGQIPPEVFTQEFNPPTTDGSGNNRANLQKAQQILKAAGWSVKDGLLQNDQTRKHFAFEILLAQPDFERIVLPYVKNLERLGIQATVRTVDTAQYQQRVDEFDFDAIIETFPESLSPGNEQRDFWGSQSADEQGGRNVIGIKDPAIDKLVDLVIAAPDRPSLITRTHALDRVLLWNHFVVPQWHIQAFRVAYWDKFGRPETSPKYALGFDTWWVDPEKEKALNARSGEQKGKK
jgi:microcin C transport system substrate-binding protein